MTVHDTAMSLIRQRGTACSDPEFIAAYLQQELNQARDQAIAYVERFLAETTNQQSRCPRCGGLDGVHGLVHVRHGNGGGHNEPCPNQQVKSTAEAGDRS